MSRIAVRRAFAGLAALMFAAWIPASAQMPPITEKANEGAKPAQKKPTPEALQPEPSPVRVEGDAVKLPDKQFEIPPEDQPPDTTPDDPPAKKPAKKKKR